MGRQVTTSDPAPDSADVERSLKALEGNDRVGTAGEVAGVAGGAAAGAAAAGAVAGALGGTTLLGSSTLASVLGGVFVATTPVGWVVGCAALGGAAAYVVVKAVRSSGRQDERRRRLSKAIKHRRASADTPGVTPITDAFARELEVATKRGALSSADAERMKLLVSQGRLPVDVALQRLRLVAQVHDTANSFKA